MLIVAYTKSNTTAVLALILAVGSSGFAISGFYYYRKILLTIECFFFCFIMNLEIFEKIFFILIFSDPTKYCIV